MTVYCAFCYLDWDNKKLEAQEILTSDKVDRAFIVGLSTDARLKAYELAKKHIDYGVECLNEKLSYRYGYFSIELGNVQQERVTLVKEFECGCAMM